MKFIRALTVAALFAALFVLALPVHADCGDGDPTCLLEPPISVEIRTDSTSGDASLAAAESGALVPLDFAVPMPLPRRVEAPLVSSQSEIESTDSIPYFTSLSIPMRYQTVGDVSCGVQALGMALDGIDGSAPTSNSLLGFLQDQGMMYDFGTGVEELAHAAQNFGYAGSLPFHGWSLEKIKADLSAGRPVVIDLGANGSDEPGHFVALTGISPDDTWIAYSDPLLGERMVPLDDFLDLWALQGNSGVAVAEAPPAPLSPDYAPWAALAATMMATLALAPSMLSDVKRRGVGGMLIAEAGSGTVAPYFGMNPPYAAPAGMKWLKGAAVYETSTRTEIVYHEVPKKELQRVQVGTTTKKIPYTKRILVDNGRWVTDYKSERYIRGYRNKRILDGYRTKRYVKYYRTRLVRTRWGYSRRRTPVYGYKRTPVYRNLRVPIYGTRKVPNGRHWESKWEHEEYTEYKTVVKRVYEERWVNVGFERIPEEETIKEEILLGYNWYLIHTQPFEEPSIIDEMQDLRAQLLEQNWMMTTAYTLTLREGPSSNSAALGYIPYGTYIHWTGVVKEIDNISWYKVYYQFNGEQIEGWVSKNWLTPYISGTANVLFDSEVERVFEEQGVAQEGNWNLRDKRAAAVAIDAVAKAFARELGISESQAFEVVFKQVTLAWGTESDVGHLTSQCSHIESGGCTSSAHLINFMSLWSSGPYRSEEVAFQASVNNVVHEFGHAFANLWWTVDSETGAVIYPEDGPYHQLGLREYDYLLTNDGFQAGVSGANNLWRQHPEEYPSPNEVFADMFLGWVSDQWLDDRSGERKRDYMNENMEIWIQQMINKE